MEGTKKNAMNLLIGRFIAFFFVLLTYNQHFSNVAALKKIYQNSEINRVQTLSE